MKVTVQGAALQGGPPTRAPGGGINLKISGGVVGSPTICIDVAGAWRARWDGGGEGGGRAAGAAWLVPPL
jgi:hypothetical protein